MNKYERLSLTFCILGFVAVFLPTAFAGGFNCYGCSSEPLLSPSQCNMSTVDEKCNDDSSGTGSHWHRFYTPNQASYWLCSQSGLHVHFKPCWKKSEHPGHFPHSVWRLQEPFMECYAATAELMNGTIIGFKGCFSENANCNNVRACDRAQNVTGASFKRCVADCCDTYKCNQYLHQVLPSISVPATPTATATATASVSVNTTHAPTTEAHKEYPSAAGIKIKAFCYLPIFLLVVIQMMI